VIDHAVALEFLGKPKTAHKAVVNRGPKQRLSRAKAASSGRDVHTDPTGFKGKVHMRRSIANESTAA
jgi:hypothetical protein